MNDLSMNNKPHSKVSFRDFEDRDVDFIYRAKNNPKITSNIVKNISSFSYEDAQNWVNGCMNHDKNYRFWAICTNDDFQNIVGWCGISNIDYDNRKVCARGITIADAKFNDGIAWYETLIFLCDYVFYTLNFNRFYTITLTSNTQTMLFNERLFLNTREGLLRKAVLKNDTYHDVAIHALLKEEYDSLKQNRFSYESYVKTFKSVFDNDIKRIESIDDFIEEVKRHVSSNTEINKNSKFRDFDEWSSMWAMDMVVVLESGFGTNIDLFKIQQCETLEDLYYFAVKSPRNTHDMLIESIEFEEDINDIKGF